MFIRDHFLLELRMDITNIVLANKFNINSYRMLKVKLSFLGLMREEEKQNLLESIRFDVQNFRNTIIRSE